MTTFETTDPTPIIDRYVAMWNEPDPQARDRTIGELWSRDCVHVLQAPQEMRDAARAIGFPRMTLDVRGHDELSFRVGRAQHEFVAEGGYRFRSRGDGARLGSIVKFHWEMVPAGGDGGEEIAAVGLDVLELDADGRILTDYQFIEA